MTKGVGRPEKIYPENQIKEIVKRYVEDEKVRGSIAKKPFGIYFRELFIKGEIPWLDQPISLNYWTRSSSKGFKILEEYNQLVNDTVIQSVEPELKLPNLEKTIFRYNNKPDKLLEILEPYPNELIRLVKKIKILENEIKSLNLKVHEKSKRLKDKEHEFNLAQETIYNLFDISNRKDNNIINLVSIKASMNHRVANALENIFNQDALDYIRSKESQKNSSNKNVLELSRRKSFLQDYDKI
ncbi:hypothetical protein [Sutcliffiella horikoshii]|uniref:Uncharacterized protein n=1 Tax=Sutcliffiella horikoshii TaxID=79883 RepID=A0A5D4TE93_9BACI|nr:hypothetical protein [Sutcliffiella horikoshii]TYS72414.1 hypothetical protein FZC75_10720 [Sutcliffiella horikoshii]